jgi:hypothetical protein
MGRRLSLMGTFLSMELFFTSFQKESRCHRQPQKRHCPFTYFSANPDFYLAIKWCGAMRFEARGKLICKKTCQQLQCSPMPTLDRQHLCILTSGHRAPFKYTCSLACNGQ